MASAAKNINPAEHRSTSLRRELPIERPVDRKSFSAMLGAPQQPQVPAVTPHWREKLLSFPQPA
jgi:hypothetical protein